MTQARLPRRVISRVVQLDQLLTVQLNRSLRWRAVRSLLRLVSRLGNGLIWFVLMIGSATLGGSRGAAAALHMGLTALVTVLVYRIVKGAAQRPRPGAVHAAVLQGIDPLDEYSFPSGHTMHAVVFTLLATAWFPHLSIILVPFSLLTGVSRVALGLHYPTDVILGAVMGTVIGHTSLAVQAAM